MVATITIVMASLICRTAGNQTLPRCTAPPTFALLPSSRNFFTATQRCATYRRFGETVQGRADLPANANNSSMPFQQLINLARSGSDGGRRRGSKGRGHSNRIVFAVVGFGGTYYVFHLERVPSTGRWRFIDVSSKQEKQMGEDSFQQVLQENRGKLLSSSDPRVKFVHSIAERIVIAAQKSDHPSDHLEMGTLGDGIKVGNSQRPSSDGSVEWEVFVINDKQKNAFVLPNGKIFVYSGILPICQDQDGLATVLGHEVSQFCLCKSKKIGANTAFSNLSDCSSDCSACVYSKYHCC